MANKNDNGFSGNLTLDVDPDVRVPRNVADLYNPGYSEGDSANRSDLVATDGVHDISNASKVTLGKYLSAQTRGVIDPTHTSTFQQSPYDISASVKGPLGISVDLNVSKALESALASTQLQIEGRTFGTYLDVVGGVNPDAANAFGMTSHGSLAAASSVIGVSIDTGKIGKVGKQIGQALGLGDENGNVALLKVKGKGDAKSAELGQPKIGDDTSIFDLISLPIPGLPQGSRIQNSVKGLLGKNRFSPVERAFVQNHTRTGTGIIVQNNMGASAENTGLLSSIASFLGIGPFEMSDDQLKNIAPSVLSRAAGASPSLPLEGTVLSSADNGNGSEAEPRATGTPYIPVERLRAGDRTKYSATEYVNSEPGERGVLSYGSINTPAEPFDGPVSPEPMFKIVATGYNEVLDITNKVRSLVQNVENVQSEFNSRATTLAGVGGHRTYISLKPQNSIFIDLGIPSTVVNGGNSAQSRRDWYECFLRGVEEYLGFDISVRPGASTSALDLENLPQGLKDKVSAAPGYYVAIARNSMRGTQELSAAVNDAFSTLSSTDQATRKAALKSLISLISNSSSWKFTLAMISLGYRRLEGGRLNAVEGSGIPTPNKIGGVHDSRDPSGKITTRHSLFVENGLTSYVLPSTLSIAASRFGEAHETMGLKPTVTVPGDNALTGSKISAEVVQKIENALDSEHMPFYFHDLRTNEIIAFHAFLTELTDSFSPNYTSTAAYGRGDEVMVYNNTKRSINFGFTLVAMSPDDMDLLYWNVNKLVSMVYPQYSKGRLMVSGDQKFIQPFSQIPTASPMIRVRIGDMVKSNYSRFGLARLFGLGHDDSFKASTARQRQIRSEGRSQNLQKAQNVVAARRKSMRVADASSTGLEVRGAIRIGDLINANGDIVPSNARDRRNLTREHIDLLRRDPTLAFKGVIESSFLHTREDGTRFTGFTFEVLAISEQISGAERSFTTYPAEIFGDYNRYILIVDQPAASSEGGAELVEAELDFTTQQRQRIYDQALQDFNAATEAEVVAATDEKTAVREFFDPGQNPIVRSFESTRGRGMAGFITSLGFDWADSTWDIEPGKRGPQMMKVTVQFSPIHDIPLGLDSDGAMRSVAYGIGKYSLGLGGDPYDKIPGT